MPKQFKEDLGHEEYDPALDTRAQEFDWEELERKLVDHALINFYEARGEMIREIPDCALDKHTLRGRQKRRGHEHFWTEGAKLANAAPLVDPYYERARRTRREIQTELPVD